MMYPQHQQNAYMQQFSPEITTLLFQKSQFNINNPPFVPQVPCISPIVQSYYPAIAALIANDLNNNCEKNNLRRLIFNLAVNNGYQNEIFVKIFQFAVDLFDLEIFRNTPKPIDHIVSEVAIKACSYSTASMIFIQKYEKQLRTVCDHSVLMEVEKLCNNIAYEENEIQKMKMAMLNRSQGMNAQQPFQQYGNQGFQTPQQHFQPQFHQSNTTVFTAANNTLNQNHSIPGSAKFVSNDTHIYTSQASTQPDAKPYYERPSMVPNVKVEVRHFDNQQQSVVNQNPVEEWDAVTKWVPSEEFPLPPVVNAKTQKFVSRTYFVLDSATGKQRSVTENFIVNRSQDEMDKDVHTIQTINQVVTSHIPDPYITRDDYVKAVLSSPPKTKQTQTVACKESDQAIENLNNVVVKMETILTDTLEDAIFKTKVELLALPVEECDKSFRSFAVIPKKFVSRKDQNFVIDKLSRTTSFAELASVMQNFLTSEFSSETHDFIRDVDRYICKELIRFLNIQFSSSIDSITSFIDDHSEIGNYLRNIHSEMASDKMKANESVFINSFLKRLDGEEIVSLFDDKVGDTFITYIDNGYSITVLNVDASELGLELSKTTLNDGNLLIQSANPYFYEFVKELVNKTDSDWKTSHILIVTKDDVVFEVSRSIIGLKDNFVISYFK